MKKLILLFLVVFHSNTFAQSDLPNVTIKNINNESVNLNDTYNVKDKIYVFSFWATWCSPCLQELDAYNDIYSEWKSEINFEIIAISIDDSKTQKRVKPLLNGKSWDFNVLIDTNQELKRKLGIINVPYTLVVKNSKIVYIQNGYTPSNEKELHNKLKSLN
jgi:peroxiredoxin